MNTIWEYLVSDFLETACRLGEKDRSPLLRELGRAKISADEIDVHPAFSIAGKVIVVGSQNSAEFWLYQPSSRKIQKANLKNQ